MAATALLLALVAPVRAGEPVFDVQVLPGATPDLPSVATHGSTVLVSGNGPTVARSTDEGASYGPVQSVAPDACTSLLGGLDSVVVAADGTEHAFQNCGTAAFTVLHYTRPAGGTTWRRTTQPVLEDVDGGLASVDPTDPRRLFVVAHDFAGYFGLLSVAESDDAGETWTRHVVPIPPELLKDNGPNIPTPVLADPRHPSHLLVAWTAEDLQDDAQDHADDNIDPHEWHSKVFAARSDDSGATWSVRLLLDTGEDLTLDHTTVDDVANWWPGGAVDDEGTAYVTITRKPAGGKATKVQLFTGRDFGASWSTPRRVDDGSDQSAFAAQVVACRSGHVGVAWLSTHGADPDDPAAQWRLTWASSTNGRTFHQVTGAQVLHTGALDPLGKDAPPQHTLGLALAGDGRPLVAVPRDAGPKAYELVVARGGDQTKLPC